MIASRVKAVEAHEVSTPADTQLAAVSAIVLQHPAAKASLAPVPFHDENTHNAWLDIMGLNA